MRVPLNKTKKLDISAIMTFIVIYVSNDTLLFGTNADRRFFWLHVAILLMSFVFLAIKTKRLSRQMTIFSLLLVVMMIITQAVNRDTEYIKYIYNIFVVMLCLLFCNFFESERFFSAFLRVMYYIAIFAIVLFALWMLAEPIMRRFPSIINESGIRYYFFGLGFLENLRTGVIPRMYGIFREPGVFACYLSFSLIVELYFMQQLNIKRAIVFSVAAILTFSTAAYILLAFILGGYLARQVFGKGKPQKKTWRLLFLLLLTGCVIAVLLGPERIFDIVFNKLKITNSSRDSRFGSVEANIRMFLQNPVLGKGWHYVEGNFIYFAGLGNYQGRHNTNTFLKLLALYGVVPFACILYGVYRFFRRESRAVFWGLFLTAMWMVALSNEDFSVNILFYLLPMYGIKKDEIRERACGENTGD